MLSKAGGVTGGAGGMGVGGAAGQAGGNLISCYIIALIFSPWIAHEIIFLIIKNETEIGRMPLNIFLSYS